MAVKKDGSQMPAKKPPTKKPAEKQAVPPGIDKTVLKALGLSGGIFGACPSCVDVKDGKIIRIRPLHWDSLYDPKTFNPWKITKNGKTLEPRLQEAGVLSQPGQVPDEADRLGSQGRT